MNLPIFGAVPGEHFFASPEPEARTHAVHATDEDDSVRHASKSRRSYGYGKPVCVRLCDGFFFPTASVAGGDAACAAQCPDSPTALYTMPGDSIDDAVSSTGAPYSKLPVAKRYQTSFENTCSCHRESIASHSKDLLRDNTLRKGDVVMTANGFRVYEGDGYGPSGTKDFVSLAKATGVSKEERATLTAMEKTGAGSPPPAAPTVIAARPKGNVTVDNGDAPPSSH